jgi:hypothetical protein
LNQQILIGKSVVSKLEKIMSKMVPLSKKTILLASFLGLSASALHGCVGGDWEKQELSSQNLGGQTDVTAATEIAVESDTDDADGSDAASEGCDRRDPDFWYGLGGCYWSGGRGFADFLDWLGLVSNYCHPYERSCDTGAETIDVTGELSGNNTWTSDRIYLLQGRVVVPTGATLTIEPGTIIKGQYADDAADAAVLLVARGGKIMAEGTAERPITFTAESDNISVGSSFGSNLVETDTGLWGGLIILGNAPCSFSGDGSESHIEGIPEGDPNGLYGGNDSQDNSGSIRYVSIRHSGTEIADGNEINGLTLGGVGAGTTIDNIEVAASLDDGIEFFGGTVDVSNALVWACGDDSFDVDQAYSGTLFNAVALSGASTDNALEIDGPEGTLSGAFTLNNITLGGYPDAGDEGGEYAVYKLGAMGETKNVFAYDFPAGKSVQLDDDATVTNFNEGDLNFDNNNLMVSSWQIVIPQGDDIANIFVDNAPTVSAGFPQASEAFASAVEFGHQSVGAAANVFEWTHTFVCFRLHPLHSSDVLDVTDTDGDGTGDNADAFPNDASEQTDTDGDGTGDNADNDDDGDDVPDVIDAFPLDASEIADTDGDGVGDNADAFPNDPTEDTDTDSDNIGNNTDLDDDGDGTDDASDAFPLDASEIADTDGDGVGDNADNFPNDPTQQ